MYIAQAKLFPRTCQAMVEWAEVNIEHLIYQYNPAVSPAPAKLWLNGGSLSHPLSLAPSSAP